MWKRCCAILSHTPPQKVQLSQGVVLDNLYLLEVSFGIWHNVVSFASLFFGKQIPGSCLAKRGWREQPLGKSFYTSAPSVLAWKGNMFVSPMEHEECWSWQADFCARVVSFSDSPTMESNFIKAVKPFFQLKQTQLAGFDWRRCEQGT